MQTKFKAKSGIGFQVGGFVWENGALGRFSVVASDRGPFTVEKIYVKLHKYAECPLRNEHYEQLAPSGSPAYAFYISKDVNLYEIVPRIHIGETGNWKLENGDYDEFQISFKYEPYVLFIVSVEADVVQRSNDEKIHIVTPLLPLLRVSHGNAGGCLKLANWYDINLLKNPQQKAYSSLVGDLALYQILTADAVLDRSFLKTVVDTTPPDQVQSMLAKLARIVEQNKGNTVFVSNFLWLRRLAVFRSSSSSPRDGSVTPRASRGVGTRGQLS